MGWTSSYNWQSKKDVIEEVTSSVHWGKKFNILNQSLRGNNLWVLVEYAEGDRKGNQFISLFLLSKFDEGYAYKDLDESCGPYYYNCPLSFIKSAEIAGGYLSETAKDWREKVKSFHKQQSEKRQKAQSLKSGMKVKLYGVIYELIEKYSGRQGWEVKSLNDNRTYRMNCKQVSKAELVLA